MVEKYPCPATASWRRSGICCTKALTTRWVNELPMLVANSEHSTLPRLHQKHGVNSSELPLKVEAFSLYRTTPLPSFEVATWKRAWKAGLGLIATIAYLPRCPHQ